MGAKGYLLIFVYSSPFHYIPGFRYGSPFHFRDLGADCIADFSARTCATGVYNLDYLDFVYGRDSVAVP